MAAEKRENHEVSRETVDKVVDKIWANLGISSSTPERVSKVLKNEGFSQMEGFAPSPFQEPGFYGAFQQGDIRAEVYKTRGLLTAADNSEYVQVRFHAPSYVGFINFSKDRRPAAA